MEMEAIKKMQTEGILFMKILGKRTGTIDASIGLSGVPNGRFRKRTEGAERVCNPIGGTKISTDQTTPELPGPKSHQPWSSYGSSFICSIGLPCQASKGGEVLGVMKAG